MDMSTFCQVNVVYVSYGVNGVDGIETIVLYNIFCDALWHLVFRVGEFSLSKMLHLIDTTKYRVEWGGGTADHQAMQLKNGPKFKQDGIHSQRPTPPHSILCT